MPDSASSLLGVLVESMQFAKRLRRRESVWEMAPPTRVLCAVSTSLSAMGLSKRSEVLTGIGFTVIPAVRVRLVLRNSF